MLHPFTLFMVSPLLYLDPGSGSFLIQLLLAVGLGLSVAAKMYWGKLKRFFTGGRGSDQPQPVDEDDDDAD